MSINISSESLIRLIEQFFSENNLLRSLRKLEEESGIEYKGIPSLKTLLSQIEEGKWHLLLSRIDHISLSIETTYLLYETIIFDLLNTGESELAKVLLKEGLEKYKFQNHFPEKSSNLVQICRKTFEGGLKKVKQSKKLLVKKIKEELQEVQEGRLFSLISDAMLYQKVKGKEAEELKNEELEFDLFTGKEIKNVKEKEESNHVTALQKVRKISEKYCLETLAFSPDGNYLATASEDGIIEILDPETLKLKAGLEYQERDLFLLHQTSVLAVNFSTDSNLLCSGDKSSEIRIWRISDGKCLRKLEHTHSEGVTSILFYHKNSQIISGSYDGTIRIHGLKSGSLLKELKGHTSFITKILLIPSPATPTVSNISTSTNLLSSSADGSLRLWDISLSRLLKTMDPSTSISTLSSAIRQSPLHNIILSPASPTSHVLIVNSTNALILYDFVSASVLLKYGCQEQEGKAFVDAAYGGKQGQFVYALDQKFNLFVWDSAFAALKSFFKIGQKKPVAIYANYARDALVSYGSDARLCLWK